MKKNLLSLLALLLILVSLCGCKQKEEDDTSFDIKTLETDMSVYTKLSEEQQKVFKEIDINTLEEILNSNASLYIYMGYPDCEKCQNAVVEIASNAIANNETIYYLNCMKLVSEDETYNKAIELMHDVLNTNNETGDKVIQAPELIKITNGKYDDYTIGYSEDKTDKYKELFNK